MLSHPRLSIIVPVHDAAAHLARALAALQASSLARSEWELIVVADGCRDRSAAIAAGVADHVIELPWPPRGPAHARNVGAAHARAPLLGFVDADVCVHPDALARMMATMARGGADAVIGTYDDAPPAPGAVSRYRNLAHAFAHRRAAGRVSSFWAGLGAMSTARFRQLGGFDAQRYPTPSIEDVELGYRLVRAGGTIILDPELRGTHLKAWTLRGGIRTDLLARATPWMALLLDSARPDEGAHLGVGRHDRMTLALTGVALGAPVLGALRGARAEGLAVALTAMALAIVLDAPLHRFVYRRAGARVALAGIALRFVHQLVCALAVAGAGASRLRRRRPREVHGTPPLEGDGRERAAW
ncbi:MAG: glycosyltransferase family 2 protein [Gemmatimonadaceae bacterium]|nr:glycosyltransferase family 2 protein [Gemmatimonadaceae bacterium]